MAQRGLLKRKSEQVSKDFSIDKSLFQRVYYNPDLLQEDEENLRKTFFHYNAKFDRNSNILAGLGFFGYLGSVYYVAKFVKPPTVALLSVGYVFGYYYGPKQWLVKMF